MLSLLDYLQHIADEIDFILEETKNVDESDFLKNKLLNKAVVRSLEIIGEAAKRLPIDLRKKYPQIEWKEMAGTRDKLIHDYFGIDYEIVWNIITAELPEIQHEIKRIISIEKDIH